MTAPIPSLSVDAGQDMGASAPSGPTASLGLRPEPAAQSRPSGRVPTSAGYTPGPWRVRVNARDDQETCDLSICGDIFVIADLNGPQYAHQHPNARLMAAAPELLEVLIELQRINRRSIKGNEARVAWFKAAQAIAKATGQ